MRQVTETQAEETQQEAQRNWLRSRLTQALCGVGDVVASAVSREAAVAPGGIGFLRNDVQSGDRTPPVAFLSPSQLLWERAPSQGTSRVAPVGAVSNAARGLRRISLGGTGQPRPGRSRGSAAKEGRAHPWGRRPATSAGCPESERQGRRLRGGSLSSKHLGKRRPSGKRPPPRPADWWALPQLSRRWGEPSLSTFLKGRGASERWVSFACLPPLPPASILHLCIPPPSILHPPSSILHPSIPASLHFSIFSSK